MTVRALVGGRLVGRRGAERRLLSLAGRACVVSLAVALLLAGGGVEGAGAQPRRPPAAAPEAAPGDPVLVPDESDGALHEPPVIASRNGVLKASADIIRAGTADTGPATLFGNLPVYTNPRGLQPSPAGTARPPHVPLDFAAGYQFTANGTTYPAQFPAPTLRLEPGDTMDLTLRDRLGDEASAGLFPRASDLVNLHTHGVVDSPRADGDNVFRTMRPNGAYRTRVKLPTDTQPGWDWYHPHRHGFVADQVYGGLAGTLQIGDPLDPWPQYKGKFQERVLALTAGRISVDPQTGTRFVDDPNPTVDLPEEASGGPVSPYGMWRKFVNGQYNPTITIRPGETQIWGFSSMTRNANFNLGITDANGQNPWSATILSYDGNGKNLVPRPTTLGLPVPYTYDGPTVLDPGARIAMAVTAPTTPGTYYLVDDMTFRLRPQSPFFALATIKVEGEPVTEAAPVFPSTGQVPDLFTATPDHKRTFIFSNDTSGPTIAFAINESFFPNGPIVPVQVGQVEEWLLVNTSPIDHTFHIHQTDFAVTSVNSIPIDYRNPFFENGPYRYTSLRDTVNIPPGGNVVIRFRVSPELGKYVFHCHILPHEDGGMMMTVLALPNQRQRRIALGTLPGERNAVLVKDGSGQKVGTLHPGPQGARGGVVTATEDLNGDLTQDIVAGTPARAGSPASVSVYDGDSLKRISRFAPFPQSPHAGLSIAAGNIDRDGGSEIVVGRVGRGTSLVRIFRRSGAVFRTISGTLPGTLPHGVSVTSSDLNGDNYDDVAIGAGRGRAPRVVALDGFTLGDPSRPPPTTLFSFQAAGGPTAGVNLASGYYDPRTRPGPVANLITTPQQGRLAGRVQVWAPVLPAEHGSSAGAGHAHSAATDSGAPQLLANLHPLRRRVLGGVRLSVTRLGKQGLDALAAWANPRRPVYVSINDAGAVSRILPTTTLRTGREAKSRLKVTRIGSAASPPAATSGRRSVNAGYRTGTGTPASSARDAWALLCLRRHAAGSWSFRRR